MSRKNASNDTFLFVYGLDRVCGPFFQIYFRKIPEGLTETDMDDDSPALEADNRGMQQNLLLFHHLPDLIVRRAALLAHQFQMAKSMGNRHPNMSTEDILSFAALCGVPVTYNEIAGVLDAAP